jgi:hypothetical protein
MITRFASFASCPSGTGSRTWVRGHAWAIVSLAGVFLALLTTVSGCDNTDLVIPSLKPLPIADARVLRNGQAINAQMDGGLAALTFPFTGAPVTVTLDGSHSYSPDGTIVTYRWFSGTLADGGTERTDDAGVLLRWVPPGAPPNWPGDAERPQVSLGEGIWSFVLWVVDSQGAISAPSTIAVTIGMVTNPAVQQCADAVVDTESASCRQCVCMQSDMCRAAVVMTACDQTCWNLVNCVAAKCPDFTAMAAKMDYSCLTSSCSAYVSGSTAATPVAPCFNPCTSECASGSGDGGSGSGDGGSAPGDGGSVPADGAPDATMAGGSDE